MVKPASVGTVVGVLGGGRAAGGGRSARGFGPTGRTGSRDSHGDSRSRPGPVRAGSSTFVVPRDGRGAPLLATVGASLMLTPPAVRKQCHLHAAVTRCGPAITVQ